jgi:hypothetical protein
MHDSAEVIRREMDETKQQLSRKVGELEHQVSATVQSVGETVNHTVGAVGDVVRSVSHTFDIPRQIERHPWWFLGGSLALGYLAARMLEGESQAPSRAQLPQQAFNPILAVPPVERTRESAVDSEATVAAVAAAYDACMKNSARNELRGVAFNALLGTVSQVAAKVVPQAVDYLVAKLESRRNESTDEARGIS